MYGSGGRDGCRLGGGDDEGGGGRCPSPRSLVGLGMTGGGPGSAGGAHSGGMDSCLRRNDAGGWGVGDQPSLSQKSHHAHFSLFYDLDSCLGHLYAALVNNIQSGCV